MALVLEYDNVNKTGTSGEIDVDGVRLRATIAAKSTEPKDGLVVELNVEYPQIWYKRPSIEVRLCVLRTMPTFTKLGESKAAETITCIPGPYCSNKSIWELGVPKLAVCDEPPRRFVLCQFGIAAGGLDDTYVELRESITRIAGACPPIGRDTYRACIAALSEHHIAQLLLDAFNKRAAAVERADAEEVDALQKKLEVARAKLVTIEATRADLVNKLATFAPPSTQTNTETDAQNAAPASAPPAAQNAAPSDVQNAAPPGAQNAAPSGAQNAAPSDAQNATPSGAQNAALTAPPATQTSAASASDAHDYVIIARCTRCSHTVSRLFQTNCGHPVCGVCAGNYRACAECMTLIKSLRVMQ